MSFFKVSDPTQLGFLCLREREGEEGVWDPRECQRSTHIANHNCHKKARGVIRVLLFSIGSGRETTRILPSGANQLLMVNFIADKYHALILKSRSE